jgi:Spy/CpxP family protein refolding chaperone
MSQALRGVLITIFVAFVAGLGGVWAGKVLFAPQHALDLHEAVHRNLDLTPQQRQSMDALEHDFAPRRRALESEMRAANADLAAAIREEHGYGPHVAAAVERFHHAMGQLQSETIAHVFSMRNLLTPAQQTQFDNIVSTALTAEQR